MIISNQYYLEREILFKGKSIDGTWHYGSHVKTIFDKTCISNGEACLMMMLLI